VNNYSVEDFSVPTMFAPNSILKTNSPDFLRDLDLTDDDHLDLLNLAAEVRTSPADYAQSLTGKNVDRFSKSLPFAPNSPSISP
jgi:hypothetical protein